MSLLDNAVAEFILKSIKTECTEKKKYISRYAAQVDIFDWIETWYNANRRHPYLNYKTTNEFETELYMRRNP